MIGSVWDYLLFRARLRPHELAVFGPAGPVSYQRLIEDVAGLATELLDNGLTGEDLVGILLRNAYLHLVFLLALDRLNIPSASLTAPAAPAGVAALAARCFLTVVVSSDPAPTPLPCRWIRAPDLDRPKIGKADRSRLRAIGRSADQLVRVVWSSGTSGGAKGAPLTRARQMLQLDIVATLMGYTADTRYLLLMALTTSHGYTRVLSILAAGGAVILPSPPMNIGLLARTLGVTVTGVNVPILTELVGALATGPNRLEGLRLEVTGSHLPATLAREARERVTLDICTAYGASETATTAVADVAVTLADAAAVGYLAPSIEAQIVGDAHEPLSAGQEGRLRLRAGQVIDGYYRDAAATQRNFRDGWFYPGDIGMLDPEGLLRVTGRIEDVTRNGATTLSPVPVEAVIAALPGVREVAVFAVSTDGSQLPYAALVLAPGFSAATILAQARAQLGDGAPVAALVLDQLPRNANGKVAKRELAAQARRATTAPPS